MNLDFIDTADGPILLEVGCRGGGTCLVELLGYAFGLVPWELIASLSLGVKINILDMRPIDSVLFGGVCFADKPGLTAGIVESEKCVVLESSLDYGEGESVPVFETGADRFGQIVLAGERDVVIREGMKMIHRK